MSDRSRRTDLADRAENEVLRRDAEAGLSLIRDAHRLRTSLEQALGREHVLDLGSADRQCKRSERAVRRGVRVTAGDRDSRLREAELRTDHVDDPLAPAAGRIERDAELLAVAAERLQLLVRQRVRRRVVARQRTRLQRYQCSSVPLLEHH